MGLPPRPEGSYSVVSFQTLRLGHPDKNMGFDSSELETALNLSWILKIAMNTEVALL
jgi:hypothetical protein